MARRSPRQRPFGRLRPELQARIIATFGIGALALSVAIAATAYFSARSTIVGQAVTAAESSAQANFSELQSRLQTPGNVTTQSLAAIDNAGGQLRSASILLPGPNSKTPAIDDLGNFEGGTPPFSGLAESTLPSSLLSLVRNQQAAEQIFSIDGEDFIGIGIPLPSGSTYSAYIAVFPTDQVVRTLNVLLTALILGAAITTVAGFILGRWAARRALAPLRRAARTAQAISSGALDTRIETTDTSDLQILATSFNSMVDALQNRIAREVRFTSDVAHELRSPLTTLATALSVIESRRDELSERSQHALDLLSGEVRRFRQLVTDLLEISRVDASVDIIDESLVEVGPLVANALETAGAEEIPVVIEPTTAHRWLYVDKRRFGRIITNLLENAERYAGGATAVVVSGGDAEAVRIAVEDDGPGIDQSERERIFERFARGAATAGSRGFGGGSGLGLALVREHVRVLGGRVWMDEKEGGTGSRFIVELPLADPDEVEAQVGVSDEVLES